jgi:hypothetical protein
MQRRIAALAVALSLGAPASAAPFGESPVVLRRVVAAPPIPDSVPAPRIGEEPRIEVQVLLSSIDMTVSLIDAYGSCREHGASHDACMEMIRTTLEHARRTLGR